MNRRAGVLVALASVVGAVMLLVHAGLVWSLVGPEPEPVTAEWAADHMWERWSEETQDRMCRQLATPGTRAILLEVVRQNLEDSPNLDHLSATEVIEEIEKNC